MESEETIKSLVAAQHKQTVEQNLVRHAGCERMQTHSLSSSLVGGGEDSLSEQQEMCL